MQFNKPKQLDHENSILQAFENEKLHRWNLGLASLPQVFSHCFIEIFSNHRVVSKTQKQFDNNIHVRIVGTKNFCNQLKCNSYYPRGKSCTPSDVPFVFKSGNSDIDACESSCFNLFNGATEKETGEAYKAPNVMFNETQNCCGLITDSSYRLGFDDFMRTDNHTTPRVDTIGTGFDLKPQQFIDSQGNFTFEYELNKYYCDDFCLEFKDGECKPSIAKQVIGILASETLYTAIQYGIKNVNGSTVDGISKPNLPPITKATPKSLLEWKSFINPDALFIDPDVKLSTLGITRENSHLFFTTEYGWPGCLVEPLLMYKNPTTDERKVLIDNTGILPQFQKNELGFREHDEYELMGTYEVLRQINTIMDQNLTDELNHLNIADVFNALSKQLVTPEFWETVAISLGTVYVSALKRIVAYAEKMFNKVTKSFVLMAERTIFSTIVHTAGNLALTNGARAFKLLASSLKAVTVVGMILDIVGLIDLALIGQDFFGHKNLVGKNFPKSYSEMDLRFKEQVYGYKTVEYSPAMLMTFIQQYNPTKLADANIVEYSENSIFLKNAYKKTAPWSATIDITKLDPLTKYFEWTSNYITSLEYNADGLPINWELEEEIDYVKFDALCDNIENRIMFTFNGYKEYSKDIITRSKIVASFVGLAIAFALVGIKFDLFIILAMFLAIMSFAAVFTPRLVEGLKLNN